MAREDGEYYHRLQVRLSKLEDEKSIWDLERKREEEDKAACVFKFQPAATQTETAVGQNKGSQTEVPQVQEGETQTPARTYASVAAQTEVKEKGVGKHTDSMDIDSTALPGEVAADPPSAKDQNKDTGAATAPTSRAFVVHGVACIGPITHKIQEVERAFGGKGGGVIGVRWLLHYSRRRGMAASSLVVFLKRAVPTALEMAVRMRGRKYKVVEYDWGRKRTEVATW